VARACEADHSPPSNAKVKEYVELYIHSPNTPSCHGAYLSKRVTLSLPSFTSTFFYGSENCTLKAKDKSRIIAAAIRCTRQLAKYAWMDYRRNEDMFKELKTEPILGMIWIQHVDRIQRDVLPKTTKIYRPHEIRNQG